MRECFEGARSAEGSITVGTSSKFGHLLPGVRHDNGPNPVTTKTKLPAEFANSRKWLFNF